MRFPWVATGAVRQAVLAGQDLDDQGWPTVLFLDMGLAVDERLELLDAIEDCLETHPGALPELMKRGNSIMSEGCPRVRFFLSKAVPTSTNPTEAPNISARSTSIRWRVSF